MRPIYARFQNFLSHADTEIDFREGLWLIRGEVEGAKPVGESESFSSNGAGKSGLLEGLAWVGYDQLSRGLRGDDVIRKGQKFCAVEMELDNGMRIGRSRKRGKGSVLTIEGELATQEQIENIFGADFNTFISSVIHFSEHKGFAEMKDKDRKDILAKILGLERYDTYQKKAKELADSCKNHISELKQEFVVIERAVEDIPQEIEYLKEKEDKFVLDKADKIKSTEESLDYMANRMRELKGKISEIPSLKKQLSAAKVSQDEAKRALSKAEDVLKLLEDNLSDIRKKEYSYQFTIGQAEKQLKDLKEVGAYCNVCFQEVPADHVSNFQQIAESLIKENIFKIADLKLIKDKVLEEHDNALAEVKNLQSQHESYKSVITTIQHYLSDREGLQNEVEETEKLVFKYKEDLSNTENSENSFHFLRAKKVKELVTAHNKQAKLIGSIAEQEEELGLYEFWIEGFGRRGIPSLIYDTIVPEFSFKANRYIQSMTNNDIRISMDTQTEKKTGGYSEKFNIIVEDEQGSRPYEAWSGGEKKRVSVAIDMALSDIAASRSMVQWDFCGYDEAFDGLDEDGKMQVFDLLRGNGAKSIYVISHDNTIQDFFDNQVVVYKKDGVSYI